MKTNGGLIGRKKEVDRILALAAQVQAEKRSLSVLVVGKAGIGRTAVINFAANRIAKFGSDFHVLGSVSCRGIPSLFFPIDHLVIELLHIKPAIVKRSSEGLYDLILSRLVDLGLVQNDVEMSRHARILTGLLAAVAQKETEVGEEMTTPVEKYLYSVRRIMSLLAERKSLVVTLDDLHLYPVESMGLVRALRTGLMNRPILWIFATEKSADDTRPMTNEIIELPPLGKEETAAFLMETFPDLRPFPEDLVEVLYSTSGGVPGLLHHHVGLLIDNRILELGEDGQWRFNGHRLVPENFPIGREAAIDLKIGRLDDSEREILTLAAAVGDVFWDDALLAMKRALRRAQVQDDPALIWPDDSEILGIQTVLDRLCQMGLLGRLESQEFYGVVEYAFTYEGLRERLVAALDAPKSKTCAEAMAHWLEMVVGERRGEYGEIIALNFEKAGAMQTAATYYIEAARVAKSRYLYDRAFDLYRRALEKLEDKAGTMALESLHEMGNMAQALGKMDVAIDCFQRMLSIAWRCVSRAKAAASLSKIGRIHRQKGDLRAARAFLERSLSLFTQAGDFRGIASTKDDLGTIAFLTGNYDQAINLYGEALSMRLQMNDERGVALSYEHIGQIARASANYEEAERHCRQALEIRRRIGDEEGVVSSLNFMGIIAYERGNMEDAISIWKEAREHAVRIGNLRMTEYLDNNIGEAFMELERGDVAEAHFKQSMEIAMTISDRRAEAEVCKNLGLLYTKTGNIKAAREHLNRSLVIAREMGHKEQMGVVLRALGQLEGFSVFDGEGQIGAAESYFQEALDIFRLIANESEYLRTMEVFGKYLFDHGRVEEAISVMENALAQTTINSEEIKNRFRDFIKRMKQFAAS